MQDYYSLRSVAQGFGVFYENLARAKQWVESEMNSVNDNPIVVPEHEQVYHTANFMGYYVSSACDMLRADIAQAATWIHALVANLVHPRKNRGLPVNLIEDPTNYSGFRPIQILAASLTVQCRKLAQSHASFVHPDRRRQSGRQQPGHPRRFRPASLRAAPARADGHPVDGVGAGARASRHREGRQARAGPSSKSIGKRCPTSEKIGWSTPTWWPRSKTMRRMVSLGARHRRTAVHDGPVRHYFGGVLERHAARAGRAAARGSRRRFAEVSEP